MPTTLTNGIQLPDKGSVDWYSSMQSNYNLIDTHLGDTDVHVTAEDKANWNSKQGSLSQAQLDAIAQVATNTDDIASLQSGKANASHTHSSSDITDIDDYATKQYVDTSISDLVDNAPDALNTLNELSAALNDDSNFASTVTTALADKANSADLATVATSGDYDDLSNKPSIPTNTSDLNNDSGFVTLNDFDIPAKTSDLTNDSGFITSSDVPTSTSDLINDSNFVDTSNPAVSSGITSAKVTSYDSHLADTDIHVTTADKATWNTVISKANDSDVVHNTGNESVGGIKNFTDNTYIKSLNFTNKVPSPSSSSSSTLPIITTITYGDSSPSQSARLNFRITADGIKSLYPHENNQYALGLQSRKWATINGLEPSALGMPDLSNGIDISSYFDLSLYTGQTYTPTVNGWISISITSPNRGSILCESTGLSQTAYGVTDPDDNTKYRVSILIPCQKNQTLTTYIRASSGTINFAKFYPCQGNV